MVVITYRRITTQQITRLFFCILQITHVFLIIFILMRFDNENASKNGDENMSHSVLRTQKMT